MEIGGIGFLSRYAERDLDFWYFFFLEEEEEEGDLLLSVEKRAVQRSQAAAQRGVCEMISRGLVSDKTLASPALIKNPFSQFKQV